MIGPIRADEARAVAALHAGLFERPWTEQEIDALLRHDASLALAARTPDQSLIEGFAIAFLAAGELELLSIAVAPERQRHGIARGLMTALLSAARRLGAHRVHLEVADDNVAARRLYAGLKFVQAGRRQGYYQNRRLVPADALVLTSTL